MSKRKIAMYVIELLIKFGFIDEYDFSGIQIDINYKKYGIKEANNIFGRLYNDLSYDDFNVDTYKNILSINEPESVKANLLIKRKGILGK